MSMNTINDPHLAAVLLKKYLRDLPEPIFPEKLYQTIRRCPAPSDDITDISSVTYIRDTLLPALPHCVYIVLSHYLREFSSAVLLLIMKRAHRCIDLMHEVSLRSASNRMDAHNLAVVLCPNLVKSADPIRDVAMCAVPGGPTLYDPTITSRPTAPVSQEGKTTVGAVVKLCIQRYYEIFDEVHDRSEAILQPGPRLAKNGNGSGSPGTSSLSLEGKRQSAYQDDDEDIDDAMLVMPIGPSSSAGGTTAQNQSSTPAASQQPPWGAAYQTRNRNNLSGARSVHMAKDDSGANGNGYSQSTVNKARSMISIDNGRGLPGTRKGSISVGRGTRKSSGAGVEAISVTAGGFFMAPSSAPPLPSARR